MALVMRKVSPVFLKLLCLLVLSTYIAPNRLFSVQFFPTTERFTCWKRIFTSQSFPETKYLWFLHCTLKSTWDPLLAAGSSFFLSLFTEGTQNCWHVSGILQPVQGQGADPLFHLEAAFNLQIMTSLPLPRRQAFKIRVVVRMSTEPLPWRCPSYPNKESWARFQLPLRTARGLDHSPSGPHHTPAGYGRVMSRFLEAADKG